MSPLSSLDPELEVAFVDGGIIVEHGDPEQVLRHPRQERTKQFLHRLLFPF